MNYNVVQIFDSKWARKMLAPTHHIAFKELTSLEVAKARALQCLNFPTIAVHVISIDEMRTPRAILIGRYESDATWHDSDNQH